MNSKLSPPWAVQMADGKAGNTVPEVSFHGENQGRNAFSSTPQILLKIKGQIS